MRFTRTTLSNHTIVLLKIPDKRENGFCAVLSRSNKLEMEQRDGERLPLATEHGTEFAAGDAPRSGCFDGFKDLTHSEVELGERKLTLQVVRNARVPDQLQ
jgi:hypothetical protein